MNRPRTAAALSSCNSMLRQGLPQLARLALLWAAILFPISVYAQTYDGALDFSGINNPTGVWSYGTKPVSNLGSGTFTLYPNVFNYGSDVRLWTHSTFIDAPFLSRNTNTSSPVNDGLTLWTPGQLVSHAGNLTASVLRFTVPTTGVYDWHVTFSNQSGSFSGTNVYFYYNSVLQTSWTLGTFGDSVGTGNVTSPLLNAGDFMEFMVAPRADTSFNSTSTGIDVQLTTAAAVPEPASLALIGFSVVAGSGVFWYRRRQQLRQAQQSVDLSSSGT